MIRDDAVDMPLDGGQVRRVPGLGCGNSFERALITGEPRSATVRARCECLVYTMGKASFEQAMHAGANLKEQVLSPYFQRQ